jgi:hypothetical protein
LKRLSSLKLLLPAVKNHRQMPENVQKLFSSAQEKWQDSIRLHQIK